MEGSAGHRLVSARSAIVLGMLAFALSIAALVLCASAGQSVGQVIRTMTLLPTVAVGTLVAVRRPGNPLGWLLLGAGLFFSVNCLPRSMFMPAPPARRTGQVCRSPVGVSAVPCMRL